MNEYKPPKRRPRNDAAKLAQPTQPTMYDEHWEYPEITARLLPLIPAGELRDDIMKLIENGYVDEIVEWIKETQPDEPIVKLLDQGLYSSPGELRAGFDTLTMGCLSFDDTCGSSIYFLQRRVGKKFHFWSDWDSWFDHTFVSDAPMTRKWLQKTVREVLSAEITCPYVGYSAWGDRFDSLERRRALREDTE